MKNHETLDALQVVEEALKKQAAKSRKGASKYFVPSLWVTGSGTPRSVEVDPAEFYLQAIAKVKEGTPLQRGSPTGGEWSKNAVIYNMFVRTTSAFDHNRNGALDMPVNEAGFRETGTFLKAIAMLSHIRRLGANTIHLLPITAIGHDGNKGTLGSPYAIRNPYELDENQCEPSLGLGAKAEFKAFVEAAHAMGFRVVVEFVFRTAAKDSDWVKEHPEWMYWIRDAVEVREPNSSDESKYGSPVFTREELDQIHRAVAEQRFHNLLPPHAVYRQFFTDPPQKRRVKHEDGRYVGVLTGGVRVKIPGAFADWPPDDTQPPWGDVTYLRLYNHPAFNYIAYNTVRMYDSALAQPQNINTPLWERILGIVPYYQQEFGIDGVMIDMGHALPMALKADMVKMARSADPDFAFWDENFTVAQKSRDEGYNAVVGYLWVDQYHRDRMKTFCRLLEDHGFPIPFFATPESHNTPRAAFRQGGVTYARWSIVINSFLPGIPFIHSGFEIAETYPINTGLDFTKEELKRFPSAKLPLFSEYSYDWLNKNQITDFIAKVLSIRERYRDLVTDMNPRTFFNLHAENHCIVAFARISHSLNKRVAVIGNANYDGKETAVIRIETSKEHVVDLLSDQNIPIKNHHIHCALEPGQCVVFEY